MKTIIALMIIALSTPSFSFAQDGVEKDELSISLIGIGTKMSFDFEIMNKVINNTKYNHETGAAIGPTEKQFSIYFSKGTSLDLDSFSFGKSSCMVQAHSKQRLTTFHLPKNEKLQVTDVDLAGTFLLFPFGGLGNFETPIYKISMTDSQNKAVVELICNPGMAIAYTPGKPFKIKNFRNQFRSHLSSLEFNN